jgi:hypothetical protein
VLEGSFQRGEQTLVHAGKAESVVAAARLSKTFSGTSSSNRWTFAG